MPSSPFPPLLAGFGLLFIAIPLIGIAGMIALIVLAVIANRRRGRMAGPQRPLAISPESGEPYPPAWYLAMLANQQQDQPPLASPAHHQHMPPQQHHQPPMHTHAANPSIHSPTHSAPSAPPSVGHH